jgi:hypothetical protein
VRRVAYAGVIVIWLIVMCFPITAFLLATRGEIRLGSTNLSGIRIFLISEVNAKGVGFQWNRQLPDDPECIKTSLMYLLWDGNESGINTNYCWCYDLSGQTPQVSKLCPAFQ